MVVSFCDDASAQLQGELQPAASDSTSILNRTAGEEQAGSRSVTGILPGGVGVWWSRPSPVPGAVSLLSKHLIPVPDGEQS